MEYIGKILEIYWKHMMMVMVMMVMMMVTMVMMVIETPY